MTTGSSDAWRGWEHGTAEYRRITIGLFAAGFATFAQVFDAQAVLPAVSTDAGVDSSVASLLVSAATLGVAVSVLPWAWVADRIGRTRAMKASILAASVLGLVTPLLPSFESVVAGRLVLGLALGAVPGVSIAYLTEELVPRRVAIAAGVFVSGNTLGGISGRLVAGPLSEALGWRPALLTVAALAAACATVFLIVIPLPRGFHPARRHPYPLRTRILFQLRDPVMLGLYAQGLLLMGAFGALYNYFGYHLREPPYGLPAALVSLLFAAYLLGTLASRLSGRLVVRFGVLPVILAGVGLMLAGLLLMAGSPLVLVVTGLAVFTVGCFLAHPAASGQTGARAQLGRAQATALYQLSWLGGTALFGWLGGIVYDGAGWAATLSLLAAMCVAAGAIAIVLLGGPLAARRPALPPPSSLS